MHSPPTRRHLYAVPVHVERENAGRVLVRPLLIDTRPIRIEDGERNGRALVILCLVAAVFGIAVAWALTTIGG